jgi:hypothetical protein
VFSPTATYNAAVIFPAFSIPGNAGPFPSADTAFYFDDLTYAKATAAAPTPSPSPAPAPSSAPLVFASNYSEAPTPWKSVEGGDAGRYAADGALDWWSGLAAGDSTPSFYFGYGLSNTAWGFGAYVNAPGNGTAAVSGYTSLKLSVWGNDEMTSRSPTFTVILQSPPTNGCVPEVKSTLAVTGVGVKTYTLPLSNFALQTACGYASAAQALATGVKTVHVQVLGSNLQFVAGGDGSGNYPNGLNMGPISFTQ